MIKVPHPIAETPLQAFLKFKPVLILPVKDKLHSAIRSKLENMSSTTIDTNAPITTESIPVVVTA